MKKILKRIGIGTGAVVVIGCVGVGAALHVAEQKMNRITQVAATPLTLDASTSTLDKGRYLFNARGCADCHGAKGAGRTIIDADGMFVATPNITKGAHGVVREYSAEDWERVLRHGLKPNGKPVLIMPSEEWARMSNEDAAALISYASRLPDADGVAPRLEFPLPFKVLYAIGGAKDAAAKIDHSLPPQAAVPATVSLEHGRYIANTCMGCHGPSLSGGTIQGAPPSWPAASNLTPGAGSILKRYTDAAAFKAMMRSGVRPDGTKVSSVMPFASLREMNDTDLEALYLYFHSLPPRETGAR